MSKVTSDGVFLDVELRKLSGSLTVAPHDGPRARIRASYITAVMENPRGSTLRTLDGGIYFTEVSFEDMIRALAAVSGTLEE